MNSTVPSTAESNTPPSDTSGDPPAASMTSDVPLPDAGTEPPDPPSGVFTCPQQVGTPNYEATIEVVAGIPTDSTFGGGFSTLEGVVWTSSGLLLSQIAYDQEPNPSRMFGFDGTQNPRVLLPQAGTNGLALGNDGQLLGARHSDGVLASINVADGTSSVLVSDFDGSVFNSPNDLAVRADGNIYFTDPDYQWPDLQPGAQGYRPKIPTRVYRVDPQGTVSVVDETRQQPNGVTLSLDENTLYSSGSGPLTRYALSAAGEIEGSEVVPVVGDMINAGDGMGIDCLGVLYVTMGNSVIAVDVTTTPDQPSIVHTFELDSSIEATNVAFGGAERSTLFISSQGASPKLFSVELGVAGRPY